MSQKRLICIQRQRQVNRCILDRQTDAEAQFLPTSRNNSDKLNKFPWIWTSPQTISSGRPCATCTLLSAWGESFAKGHAGVQLKSHPWRKLKWKPRWLSTSHGSSRGALMPDPSRHPPKRKWISLREEYLAGPCWSMWENLSFLFFLPAISSCWYRLWHQLAVAYILRPFKKKKKTLFSR